MPTANDDLAERLLDLEVRLAYQDRTIAALDEVVRGLATRVDALHRKLEQPVAPVEPAAPVEP